jgi:hypothetical protein
LIEGIAPLTFGRGPFTEADMPDRGQVEIACYRVMRSHGLCGVTIRAVEEMMKASRVRPGSYRDLPKMIRRWVREQEKITELPPHIVEMAEAFAKTVWEIAFATTTELDLQLGATEEEPRKRKRKQTLQGSGRILQLLRAVEFLFRPDATKSLVTRPLSGQEIFRRMTDRQASLTDENHIDRDLLEVAQLSRVIYRLPGKMGKWWHRGRPLPSGVGPGGQKIKAYVRNGKPLSVKRTANERIMDDAVTVLLKARKSLTGPAIADELQIPDGNRTAFLEMLRNHLRATDENVRFRRVDGRYLIVDRRLRKE